MTPIAASSYRIRFLPSVALFWFATAGVATASDPVENPILKRITTKGVRLSKTRFQKVPPPTLDDGQDATTQRSIIGRVAGRHGWTQFVRRSTVAPFSLKLAYLKDAEGRRIGHSVDLWFVAYGRLNDLTDERLEEGMLEPLEGKEERFGRQIRQLDNDELRRQGLEVPDARREKLAFVSFPLMNRVFVQGVVRAVRSPSTESIVVAWEMDPRLSDAGDLSNLWHPIEADELGKRRLGPAHSYRGYAGYAKVTPLDQPDGALFIETHVVFHEPEQWFRGSNALRSKMPLVVRENVNKFRRRLSKLPRNKSPSE